VHIRRLQIASATTIAFFFVGATTLMAQPPTSPAEPPPEWDVELGASFVGTSGNSDTSSFGASFQAHRRWTLWQMDALASAVENDSGGVQTAEQYIAALRAKRKLTERISATSGIRFERDRFQGLDLRSLLDGGLSYLLIRQPKWRLDGLTTVAWNHEDRTTGETLNQAEGLLEAVSKYSFSASADTTQRFRFYPNFSESSGYRTEAEITAQAAMNRRLALKFEFLWRYSHDPVPGFKRSDTTTTASLVVRWRAATLAPAP
jgi:putative salt-induced outer membrane protein YdiY